MAKRSFLAPVAVTVAVLSGPAFASAVPTHTAKAENNAMVAHSSLVLDRAIDQELKTTGHSSHSSHVSHYSHSSHSSHSSSSY